MEIDKRPDVKENLLNMTPVQKTDARATFEKTYRVFCEKHRPLKIVKELEQRDQQTMDEIQRFCKIVDKCMEIDYRHQLRPSSHRLEKRREKERREKERERESLRNQEISTKHQNKQNVSLERERAREQKMYHKKLLQQAKPLKQTQKSKAFMRDLARSEREKVKKWREKDKKTLFERVKERYLQYRRMKVNVIRIDPYRK